GGAATGGPRAALVRGVRGRAGGGVPADLAAVVEPDGRVRTARAVRVVLSRPRAIPEAMMLMSATNAALKSVAAALGRIARARASRKTLPLKIGRIGAAPRTRKRQTGRVGAAPRSRKRQIGHIGAGTRTRKRE